MKLGYQVFTPSFADSDGDGMGDVGGILSKLPSLGRLGVQTLWPRPLLKAAQGYSPLLFLLLAPCSFSICK